MTSGPFHARDIGHPAMQTLLVVIGIGSFIRNPRHDNYNTRIHRINVADYQDHVLVHG
jgi:hypothetical protein